MLAWPNLFATFSRTELPGVRLQGVPVVALPGLPEALGPALPSRDAPIGHRELLVTLREWKTPSAPSQYVISFKDTSDERWMRQTITLNLLAVTGICARPEIEQLLAQVGNLDHRTTAIRQAVDHLVQLGFITLHRLEMRQPLETSLVVLQLTSQGLDLCHMLGWEAIETELQRFRRLFQLDEPANTQHIERVLRRTGFYAPGALARLPGTGSASCGW